MSNYVFGSNPSVNIARTKFNRTQPHNTSFNLGEIVVLGLDEVIPGSTHRLDLGSLVRMSTPIAPIMDDLQVDIYSFFVPMRLTWEHWKEFMGESDQAGVSSTTYTIPMIEDFKGSKINTIADDMGLVGEETVTGTTYQNDISVLPFRAMALIYNRWFRNQNVESPIAVSKSDTVSLTELNNLLPGVICRVNGYDTTYGTSRYLAYKLPDYFTSSLPYAQKGDPVQIFGENALAPVMTGDPHAVNKIAISSTSDYALHFLKNDGTALSGAKNVAVNGSGYLLRYDGSLGSSEHSVEPDNLWANLSSAVNTTINDLRFAFQLQKALEKDALYGSRYWEVLRAHYAVTSPDATLQDPELLGHVKFDINVSQVLQTTGFTDPNNTSLGTPGANSVTANKSHLFTASFVEHGYLITCAVARQKRHTYSQQMNRMWLRKERFDFYHPVFANIGAQKVLDKEIYFDGSATGDQVFGYQEAWADYRFLPGYNSGYLNPARTNSLDYWTLADKYTGAPTLSTSFLKETRANLIRALATGATGPDFIGSFYFNDTVVNPMPLYSIPGFADHH